MHFAAECTNGTIKRNGRESERIWVREVFNFDRIFVRVHFHRGAHPEDAQDYTKRQKAHPWAFSMDGAVTMQADDANRDGERKGESREKARTYVKFSCCSFASVSAATVLLPQCSRNSLSRLPSPAVTAASPRSSADLRTKDHTGFSD